MKSISFCNEVFFQRIPPVKYHLPLRALFAVIPLSFCAVFSSTANADTNITNRIENPGFESNFNGWNDTDPSSISSIERSGSKAAKIDGSGGRVQQEVDISTNRNYELSAYIRGNGKLRARVNGKNYTATRGNSSSYAKRTVSFNSGGDNDLDIYLEYNGQTCRFDDVQLYEIGNSSSGGSSSGSLGISNATGTSSGSNGPFNGVDGNLNSRYSSNGNGSYLQLDLGSTKTISSVSVAWFKGNQRSAFFEIFVGTSTNNLTRVFSGTSSGNTLNLENYNFNDRSGRYVRIVGFGNTSNSWLSITDVDVIGSGSSSSTPAPAPTSSSPNASFNTPSNNASFTVGSQVVVNVNASDSDGSISNVRLLADGVFIRQENFAPYDWKNDAALRNLSVGSHTLTALVKDNAGNTTTTSININVTASSSGGGSSSGGSSGGGSGTAAAIIGNGWKLNGFSGSLNVGSSDNNLDYADDASTNESHFFFEKNGYAAFRCYPGSPTSGGSSNPRSELREEIDGGDGYWNGDTNTERSMKWKVRIEDLPPSGKLCFGQIHERDDKFDDIIRVQV